MNPNICLHKLKIDYAIRNREDYVTPTSNCYNCIDEKQSSFNCPHYIDTFYIESREAFEKKHGVEI